MRLGDLKNLRDDESGLVFIVGLTFSDLSIARIFSWRPVKFRFSLIWFSLILGRRSYKPFWLDYLALSYARFKSFSPTPAPLRSVSLWTLFSSSPSRNSYCSSRNSTCTLSISRWKPSLHAVKSTVFSANFNEILSK